MENAVSIALAVPSPAAAVKPMLFASLTPVGRTFRLLLALLAGTTGGTAFAADKPAAEDLSPRLAKTGAYVFNILPKSLQKNPYMDMTFHTEYTPYGRTLPAASPEHPVYYALRDAGYRQLGWTGAGEAVPDAAKLKESMVKALAKNGFIEADKAHQPGLLIMYFWGTHNRPDDQTAEDFPDLLRKNILERALLIGGKDLADNVNFNMLWGGSHKNNVEKQQYLNEQADDDIYYMVASAYDFTPLAQKGKERKLVWRTTMTVSAAGLMMAETLPPLVASGAVFFGRETVEPEIGSRQIMRGTQIKYGEAVILDSNVKLPSKSGETPPKSTEAPAKK